MSPRSGGVEECYDMKNETLDAPLRTNYIEPTDTEFIVINLNLISCQIVSNVLNTK